MAQLRNILLIPGPITCSNLVKQTMSYDYSAREPFFIDIIKNVRQNLLKISNLDKTKWTSILFQGSGTYANEAVISSLSKNSKIDIFSNGIYGDRLHQISNIYKNNGKFIKINYDKPITKELVEETIYNSNSTHIALAHNETTSGILNPIQDIIPLAKKYNKKIILDAISSHGGVPINIDELDIDYLVGSSNKCIQGVPGLGYVITKKDILEENKNNGKILSLDLYSQYLDQKNLEQFRFTPPVQVISAFDAALSELINEGGIEKRNERYSKNNNMMINGLRTLNLKPLIPEKYNSNILNSFLLSDNIQKKFNFDKFALNLKKNNIVVYPSPINKNKILRLGNIGDLTNSEICYAISLINYELRN